jgi:hypothetical protein
MAKSATTKTASEAAAKPAAKRATAPSNQTETYRATERGYVDGRIIEAGETFSTRAAQGSWMEPVGDTADRLARAVAEAQKARSHDPDLSKLEPAALQALATEKGVTNVEGLSAEDLITAIRAAYDKDRAQ